MHRSAPVNTDTSGNGKFGGQIGFWPEDGNAINQQFRIYTSGTSGSGAGYILPVQQMVVTGDGNVGIGTDSPTSNLHVVGDVAISSNLVVDTNTLFVDSVGNKVGIGKTNPGSALDVVGDVAISSTLDVVGDVAISSNLAVDTNTLFVDSVGNKVGIGKTNPGSALDVVGDVAISGTLTATNLIRGVVEEAVRWNSQNEGVFPQSASTRYYKIATLGTIGDAANGGKLRISGTIGGFGVASTTLIDAFVVSRGGIRYGGTLTGYGGDGSGVVDIVVYLESGGTFSVWIKVIRFFAFDFTIMGGQVSNNARRLTVLSCPTTDTSVATPTGTLQGSVVDSCSVVFTDDGKVGIGTNAPGYKLHVEDLTNPRICLKILIPY